MVPYRLAQHGPDRHPAQVRSDYPRATDASRLLGHPPAPRHAQVRAVLPVAVADLARCRHHALVEAVAVDHQKPVALAGEGADDVLPVVRALEGAPEPLAVLPLDP